MINKSMGIDSFWLKIIAIIAMTCDHVGMLFFPHIIWFRVVGRLTFPIMAFMIAEGYKYTKNLRKYELRLFVFAIISALPAYLMPHIPYNVFFTLLGGLISLDIAGRLKNKWLATLCMLVIAVLTYNCDWGFIGVITIYIFGTVDNKKIAIPCGIVACLGVYLTKQYIVYSLTERVFRIQRYYQMFGLFLAIPLLLLYNGRRGHSMKMFFYIYYPAHLVILFIIRNFDNIVQFITENSNNIAQFFIS